MRINEIINLWNLNFFTLDFDMLIGILWVDNYIMEVTSKGDKTVLNENYFICFTSIFSILYDK